MLEPYGADDEGEEECGDGEGGGVVRRALVRTDPAIERKGAANPYTSMNGNMFSLLHEGQLALRLPEEEREKFLKTHKTRLCEAYGTVMKEYVKVPDSLLEKTSELKKYFDRSAAYAKTLKPKATAKKKGEKNPELINVKSFTTEDHGVLGDAAVFSGSNAEAALEASNQALKQ